MDEFLATIRVSAGATPTKYTFKAENFHKAINKMCTLVGVSSTIEIHSYDLLEIKKDASTGVAYGYIPRGSKEGNTSSFGFKSSPVKRASEVETSKKESIIKETLYSPYQIQEA